MAKWKLSRQEYGNEEFELSEGEIKVGRGLNNLIKLSSIVISRNHCCIHVKADEVVITDLKSSNGVYVGRKKIAPNIPYKLTNNDVIGFGWAIEASLGNIKDNEKHIYKLIKYDNLQETGLKRKISKITLTPEIEIEKNDNKQNNLDNIVTIENSGAKEDDISNAKKPKLDPVLIDLTEEDNEDLEYKAFKDKQDYIMINDEPELVFSDSDFESEHLFERLSQNSPGRPLKKLEVNVEKSRTSEENTSYSQIEDDIPIDIDEIYDVHEMNDQELCKSPQTLPSYNPSDTVPISKEIAKDLSDDGSESDKNHKDSDHAPPIIQAENTCIKSLKMKLIIEEPVILPSRKASPKKDIEIKYKIPKKTTRSSKKKSTTSTKTLLTNSQKEERRIKLKEISLKEKEKKTTSTKLNTYTAIQELNQNSVNGNTNPDSEAVNTNKQQDLQNSKTKYHPRPRRTLKIIEPLHQIPTKTRIAHNKKPLLEKTKSNVTLPSRKLEKKVRFSEAPAEVREFIIEPGKNLKSLDLIKKEYRHFLIDGPKRHNVSQKKKALMKILRWNTRWLEEQMNSDQPPPIIEKENLSILFLSFRDIEQYMRQVGSLLLLEIWEYITQGYKGNKRKDFYLKIESLPPKPPRERYHELFTVRVKLSISTSDLKLLPRDGDIMIIKSESENSNKWRFCFVYNVTYLSSSANHKTYSLSFYVKYSDQIEEFNLGEVILGRNIANINNELLLLEAMEHLAKSPLRDIILKPDPSHYPNIKHDTAKMNSKWTATLNTSQLVAVREAVSAALDTAPALRLVQGPPGTGKSSVICAIVMSYFYDGHTERKHSNRGKILICATSNAAVDELVIRLLNMREKLPTEERFRMVRVGRLEAMHGRARDISSQALAMRDQGRGRGDGDPAVQQEIALYQAKMNRWKTEKTEDPARAAYCEDRAQYCARQIELLRGGEASPRQLLAEEYRLVECADIIATTLSSAVNHKMQRVKGIELCIVDEAGQAIEPEALLPLTLGVTKLTLVGDPQQLPGFICSQRAKKYGLDKSLFARLSSCSEEWERRPVVLLDRQYRMQPAIADYPNRAFYAGRVQSVPPAPVHLDLPPYCIVAITENKRKGPSCEARGASLVAQALALAAREHRPPLSVAVITPYVAHRDRMRTYLADLMQESGSPVEVNTVDSFQGQERDVVVVSVGRRRGVGFLADAGRMNVLLTRARHVLVVCLDPHAVEEHDQWRTLVQDAKSKKLFKTLPHKMSQPSSRRVSPKEVLEFLKN